MKKKFILVPILMTLILTASCMQQQQKPIAGVASSVSETGTIQRVKVTADNANVRTGCSSGAPVAETSNTNNTYDVVNPVADWYAVNLKNNQVGFIQKSDCTPVVVDDKAPSGTNLSQGASPQSTGPQQGTTTQGTTKTPQTPSAKTNSTTMTSDEQQMVKLVNDARTQNGVPALKVDMQLTNVARIKAQDMIDNKYFSHYSPKYGSPFDMMKAFGIKYVKAGENIAGNSSVQNAFNSLMNSPGHRQNILSPDYTHIGIGIKSGGSYGKMFSQMFVSKPQ